jgi:hypothetical protein
VFTVPPGTVSTVKIKETFKNNSASFRKGIPQKQCDSGSPTSLAEKDPDRPVTVDYLYLVNELLVIPYKYNLKRYENLAVLPKPDLPGRCGKKD